MRQTSYASITVTDTLTIRMVQLRRGDPGVHVETQRGTGPGGQHRNTRDTAVRAWHDSYPGIVVTRNSGRSQTINVDGALAELSERIMSCEEREASAVSAAARQIQPDVAFTHSAFEGRVLRHSTGERWSLRSWGKGLW